MDRNYDHEYFKNLLDSIWQVSIIKPSKGLGHQNIYKLAFVLYSFLIMEVEIYNAREGLNCG